MDDIIMDRINMILYYILAPLLVVELFLSDLNIIPFTWALFLITLAVLIVFMVLASRYKKNNPDYDYHVPTMYTRILVVIILIECFYTAGFYNW